MRIRQVKPSFWTDATVAAMAPGVRLFYIGLWMVADDAGWFRCNVAEIANDLYGYDSRAKRERSVASFLDALEEAGRIERLECGHGFVRKLTDHQRFSGPTKQVKTVEKEHRDVCLAPSRTSPQVPDDARPVRNGSGQGGAGSVRDVTVFGASANGDDALIAAYRRQGLPVDVQ